MIRNRITLFALATIMISSFAYAADVSPVNGTGNQFSQSFSKAKKHNMKDVYYDQQVTLYCAASFDDKKAVTPPEGFETTKYKKRAKKVEWEHVVPAENFGRNFKAWRDGHPECITKKGKKFKGRNCAGKVNTEYRYMQADMYNLYPAIGAVNASRSNYNFTLLPTANSDFGACAMKIEGRKAEPPVAARGQIARTYLYMDAAYSKYKMSKAQRKLMSAWDRMYPVDSWECKRAQRIEAIQGNENTIMKQQCIELGLW